MGLLSGKKILFCRPQENSEGFEAAFQKEGAEVFFFAPFCIEMNHPEIEASLKAIRQIAGFDWLVFSSPNGINALLEVFRQLKMKQEILSKLRIGTVGSKAAERLREWAPGVKISLQAADLQRLIDRIIHSQPGNTVRILHPASVQSLQNISLAIPPEAEIVRLPLYRTTANYNFSAEELELIRSTHFDVIIFSSPTSFDYSQEILGEPFPPQTAAIAAFGKTTANHLREKGIKANIIPQAPTPTALVQTIGEYFGVQNFSFAVSHKLESS